MDFTPCPLALERDTDHLCEQIVTTVVVIATSPISDKDVAACAACARRYESACEDTCR